MSKKEKYINYIVDDLVKKTEINYNREEITFLFLSTKPSFIFPSLLLPLSPSLSFYLLSSYDFSKHVKEIYGTKDEEIEIVWNQYWEKLESLINE